MLWFSPASPVSHFSSLDLLAGPQTFQTPSHLQRLAFTLPSTVRSFPRGPRLLPLWCSGVAKYCFLRVVFLPSLYKKHLASLSGFLHSTNQYLIYIWYIHLIIKIYIWLWSASLQATTQMQVHESKDLVFLIFFSIPRKCGNSAWKLVGAPYVFAEWISEWKQEQVNKCYLSSGQYTTNEKW